MAPNMFNKIDVNKPVENPNLKAAIQKFINERTERNALELGRQLNGSVFLIAMNTNEMIMTDNKNGSSVVQKGSVIKILNCFNEKNECFLPIFTDWEEIRLWTKENVGGLMSPSKDTWEFILSQQETYKGIVINPATTGWTLHHQEIKNLLQDMGLK